MQPDGSPAAQPSNASPATPIATYCGSISTDDDAQFCIKCGSTLEREDVPLDRSPRPLQEASEPAPEKRQQFYGRFGKWRVVAIVVGCFVLLGIIGSLLDSPEAENPPSAHIPTPTPTADESSLKPTSIPTPTPTADESSLKPTSIPTPTPTADESSLKPTSIPTPTPTADESIPKPTPIPTSTPIPTPNPTATAVSGRLSLLAVNLQQ